MRGYYRIRPDRFAGYEVQVWRWYWPFYVQAAGTNTHGTIEEATDYAKQVSNGFRDIGWLP